MTLATSDLKAHDSNAASTRFSSILLMWIGPTVLGMIICSRYLQLLPTKYFIKESISFGENPAGDIVDSSIVPSRILVRFSNKTVYNSLELYAPHFPLIKFNCNYRFTSLRNMHGRSQIHNSRLYVVCKPCSVAYLHNKTTFSAAPQPAPCESEIRTCFFKVEFMTLTTLFKTTI